MKTYTATITAPATTGRFAGERGPHPEKTSRIELSLDIDRIAQVLGVKAIRSKGGKAIDLGGLVRVKVIK